MSNLIPADMKIRRNFLFLARRKELVEPSLPSSSVDRRLARRYCLADYFFDLIQCIEGKKLDRVAALAKSSDVELMTHPIVNKEEDYLMSDGFGVMLERLNIGGYALV